MTKQRKTRTYENLTTEEKTNQSKLMELLYFGNIGGAFELIQSKQADLNFPYNKNEWTPFMWICKEFYEPEIIEKAIQLGGNLKQKNNDGETPLMIAARKRSSGLCISLLIEHGSPVNEQDNYGFTPLMRVIDHPQFSMRKDVARILIKKGADLVKLKNCQGKTAIDMLLP